MTNIAIIGASNNKKKYGYKAVRAYDEAGYVVFPINPKEEQIAGIKAYKSVLDIKENIDTASFYVPPQIGEIVAKEVVKKRIKKVFLNPGSESDKLIKILMDADTDVFRACSILAIGFHPEAFDE